MNATGPSFAGWLLHSVVGGGLLLLLAMPLVAACRQPARRQRVGEWAMLAALLLPVIRLGPSWITLPLLSSESSATAALASEPKAGQGSIPKPSLDAAYSYADTTEQVGPVEQSGEAFAGLESQRELPIPEESSGAIDSVLREIGPTWAPGLASFHVAQWTLLIGLAYAAACTCLLGRWLLGHYVLWRLLRAAQPAPQATDDLFAAMARGQKRRPRLLLSRRLRVPLSCGLVRPCVVIPANLLEPEAARTLRWVFAHELTHLQRGDTWSCVFFSLGQTFYFYLPWFWWLRRQVRLCQEYIADAAAAEQTDGPEDYAQFLISLTRAPAIPLGTLGVLGNSSDLFRRVTMLLQSPIRVEKSCPRWWSLAAASGLLGLVVLVSGIAVGADTSAADEQRTASTAIYSPGDASDPDEKDADPTDKEPVKKKPAVEKVLRDVEELLKDLPSAVDAAQLKQLQRQLEALKRDALADEGHNVQNWVFTPGFTGIPADGVARWAEQQHQGRFRCRSQARRSLINSTCPREKGS